MHVAPERCFTKLLNGHRAVSIDLDRNDVQCRADLTGLPFATARFDAAICFHVLEHIPDDAAAMRELRRVLKPTGLLLCHVPLGGIAETYENPTIMSPEDRRRHFGQEDHVRLYGADIIDRLRGAGFDVVPERCPKPDLAKRHGIREDEIIYICRASGEARKIKVFTAF